jgi:hypothetical protein
MFGLLVMLALTIQAGAPPAQGTGMIVGQVVDAGTGAPIPEAIVFLRLLRFEFPDPGAQSSRVMADGEGRFFFSALLAGDYYLQATKDGYAPGTYGQRRAWGQELRLSLAEGERLTDVTLRAWKYGVIAGTVVDEAGEPAVGVGVRALIRSVVAGRAQYGNMEVIPELVPAATTDDRGMFRLSQLMPGTYVVVVPSTHTTLPAAALAEPNIELRNNLFSSGVTEMTLLGQPRTLQIGDAALMSSSRVPIPPPPPPTGRMQMYRSTYYPAATTAAAATPIAIAAGEERGDVTIALRPVPAVRVSGRLVTPNGSPAAFTTIRLVGDALASVITTISSGGQGLETVSGMSDSSGRFTLLGVPPGDYVLRHASAFFSRALREGTEAFWIAHPVTVGADDLDLTVQARPALRVEGRMEFRGATTTHPAPPTGVTFETPFGEPGQFSLQATNDGHTFATIAPGGQYIARPYERFGWFVQSVTVAGKDVTDRAFDLQADTTSFVVTYTNQPSKVSGTVTDATGNANPAAVVVAFPVDRRRWSGYGVSPRILRSALTTRTGVYTFEHLPAGDYYVIAIDPAEMDDWKDPARLEALAGEASRLTVAASDTSKTLDLRVKAMR